jgi:hypothetical protein
MKKSIHARPAIEVLEDRWCPAITASLKNGLLTLTGTATGTLAVKETAQGTITISNGATVFAGVKSVSLKLTAPENVTVDLGGHSLANLTADLGNGTNALSILDGTITGGLAVHGGSGADAVTVGDGTGKTTLTVKHGTFIDLGGQAGDVLTLAQGSTVDNLITKAAGVTLDAGSTVRHEAIISGGPAGITVDAEGKVGGNLLVLGGWWQGNRSRSSSVTVGAKAVIGGDLSFLNAWFDAHPSTLTTATGSSIGGNLHYSGTGLGDTVTLGGTVGSGGHGGSVDLDLRGGNNKVTLASGSVISRHADIDFGNGNNSLSVAGTIGTGGQPHPVLTVHAGGGANEVDFQGTAKVNGAARVHLGSGKNTLDLHDGFTLGGTLTATAKETGNTPASTLVISTTLESKLGTDLTATGFTTTTKTPNP